MVLETSHERVSGIHSFLEPDRPFPAFGLALHLPESAGELEEAGEHWRHRLADS
jgi:hypothetical protein